MRNWFWINYGRDNGLDLFQGVSLATVVGNMGVSFGEEGMHSASGDTLATLDAFRLLYDKYVVSRTLAGADFDAVVGRFNEEYAREKLEYDRNNAEGYVVLVRVGAGYALRLKRGTARRRKERCRYPRRRPTACGYRTPQHDCSPSDDRKRSLSIE